MSTWVGFLPRTYAHVIPNGTYVFDRDHRTIGIVPDMLPKVFASLALQPLLPLVVGRPRNQPSPA
jgi:hypothetical protein